MCYTVSYLTKKKIQYAKRLGASPEEIADLEKEWKRVTGQIPAQWFATGFSYPRLPVLSKEGLSLKQWGLIPSWIKDEDGAKSIMSKTLNARSETILTKPAFRNAIKNNRCLLVIDGYFEYFHANKTKYPYFVFHPDLRPMLLAGVYDTWLHTETNVSIETVSIVTTKANEKLAKIHNNPKIKEPRMPVVLSDKSAQIWLDLGMTNSENTELFNPYPESDMEAHTVRKLVGKGAIGNTKEAIVNYNYPELQINTLNL